MFSARIFQFFCPISDLFLTPRSELITQQRRGLQNISVFLTSPPCARAYASPISKSVKTILGSENQKYS